MLMHRPRLVGRFEIETPYGATKYLQSEGFIVDYMDTPRTIFTPEWNPHYTRHYSIVFGDNERFKENSGKDLKRLHAKIGENLHGSDGREYMESFRHIAETTGADIAEYARDIEVELADLERDQYKSKGILESAARLGLKAGLGYGTIMLGKGTIGEGLSDVAGLLVALGANEIEKNLYKLRVKRIEHKQEKHEVNSFKGGLLSSANEFMKFFPDAVASRPRGREQITTNGKIEVRRQTK